MAAGLRWAQLQIREEKNKNINFWSELPADIPDTYARMPMDQKVSPHHWGCRKSAFSVRTSTGTSMSRRGLETLCPEKVCVDFLVPNEIGEMSWLQVFSSSVMRDVSSF